jgi:hypothetical protein
MCIRIGGCTAHEPRIAEEVGRAPEKLNAGILLKLLGVSDNLGEIPVRLREAASLWRDVAVVEAPKRSPDFLKKLERSIHAIFSDGEGIFTFFPWPHDGARAEGIRPGATE